MSAAAVVGRFCQAGKTCADIVRGQLNLGRLLGIGSEVKINNSVNWPIRAKIDIQHAALRPVLPERRGIIDALEMGNAHQAG